MALNVFLPASWRAVCRNHVAICWFLLHAPASNKSLCDKCPWNDELERMGEKSTFRNIRTFDNRIFLSFLHYRFFCVFSFQWVCFCSCFRRLPKLLKMSARSSWPVFICSAGWYVYVWMWMYHGIKCRKIVKFYLWRALISLSPASFSPQQKSKGKTQFY